MVKKAKEKNIILPPPENIWRKRGFMTLFFIGGGVLGFFGAAFSYRTQAQNFISEIYPVREKNSSYTFINPLLAYEVPESKEFNEYRALQEKAKGAISQEITAKNADDISLYYRDITKGRWMGVNENKKYNPASLLKVVVMIAYYQQAEKDPALLKKKVSYTTSAANEIHDVSFPALSRLQVGEKYTIEELINAMIMDSDNGATNTLLDLMDDRALSEVYTDMGIDSPADANGNYSISAKNYALFFRILYNATYLNREMSEKALKILTEAQYKDGLVAGVPAGTQVAQKFGEHVVSAEDGSVTNVELHDCGIIYKPNNPYILCIMTKGKNIDSLTRILQELSKLIYQETK